MAFQFYRTLPLWGTPEFQFIPPPTPVIVPQPTWLRADWFQAHHPEGDISLLGHGWNSIHGHPVGEFGPGLGMEDAQMWHQKVYGGLCDLEQIRAEEIGHAAAYEAFRIWIHYPHLYEHFNDSTERRRESFISLAIAEASKMIQHGDQWMDSHGKTLAAESAAATASRIFHETLEPGHFGHDQPPVQMQSSHNYVCDHHHHPSHGNHGRRDSTTVYIAPNVYPIYPPNGSTCCHA